MAAIRIASCNTTSQYSDFDTPNSSSSGRFRLVVKSGFNLDPMPQPVKKKARSVAIPKGEKAVAAFPGFRPILDLQRIGRVKHGTNG